MNLNVGLPAGGVLRKPHTRGDEPNGRSGGADELPVNPTHVGMNPASSPMVLIRLRKPHTRGDEPSCLSFRQ